MSESETARNDSPQLVVIGASAGGVEALITLMSGLPAAFPAPIVVAQHLDPHRPSQLAPLIAGRSKLAVKTVTNRDVLLPGTIYVVPADRDVDIDDHHVDVHLRAAHSPKPSVDLLLASAARVYGDGLIAVILTGTGSDGAAGAQAVKAYGGTVIVQNPETARFPGMPQAVSPAAIDIVADLEAVGPLLVDLVTGAYILPPTAGEDELRPFLDQVRARTGLDFSAYKRPTIVRRLQRRMAAVDRESLADYRRYIDRHPEELQRLVASFLIKVTEFFRDPDLFAYLREHVLPSLLVKARERGELRIWSAGCATGEEAYSLAILVADLLGDALDSLTIRIFATDVAFDAVDFARRGIYPPSAIEHLPPETIQRHFTRQNGTFEVRKSIRNLVIFGDHDLGQRAPFPRIDLVLCRNVLIYFTTELQRRALQLFAFSLRRGGYLVLGKSESVTPLPDFYSLEQPRLKVFRRAGAAMPIPALQMLDTLPLELSGARAARRLASRRIPPLAQPSPAAPLFQHPEHLLDAMSLGLITVNHNYDILVINTIARQHLRITTGAIGEDLIHCVAPGLAAPLRKVIDSALRGAATSIQHRLPPDVVDGASRDLAIACAPLWHDEQDAENAVVLLEVADVTRFAQRQRDLEEAQRQIEAEHRALRDQTHEAIAELRELRIVNRAMSTEQGRLRMEAELLQLVNEEAQAATEEIETLNEEQQATNEELETVNEELQATVEELQATIGELGAANEELAARSAEVEQLAASRAEQQRIAETERARLAAILANMGDAVLVVDEHGAVELTNDAFITQFGSPEAFAPEDERGQPLPEQSWPQRRVTRSEAFTMSFTMPGPDGVRHFFETNVQPVAGAGGEHWGVIVMRDITERSLRHQQEQFLAVAAHELRTPLTVLSGRIQLLARRLVAANADEKLKEHADRALEQVHHLEADIDELMDAARLQFGQLALDLAPLDVVGVVQQAANAAETLASATAIQVAVPKHPVIINGDERRLERVFLNLLTNAMTYAAESEHIVIRLLPDDDVVVVEVEDHGPGIPSEALPTIFSRFVRLEQGHASGGGLGLGLYIAKEIVTAHGGTIEAKSIVGEGTTIVIRLPLAGEQMAALPRS